MPAKKTVKKANSTRAAKAKLHAENTQKRTNELKLTKAEYLKEKDNPVVLDILAKAEAFAKYHTKMAQDGVGVRKTGHKLENGMDEVETIYYTNEKRITELDRAAGLLELVDYIKRQITVPEAVADVAPKAE